MNPQPLQEAIAKAEAIRDRHFINRHTHVCDCGYLGPCHDLADALAVLDAVAVLRADDDTRYVAMGERDGKMIRDALVLFSTHYSLDRDLAAWLGTLSERYHDAVAPNAKDGA